MISLSAGILLFYNMLTEVLTGANPLGTFGYHADFLAFYTGGLLILHGAATQLYSPHILSSLQFKLVHHHHGAAGYMPFLNPPFTAVLLAPLALMKVHASRVVWFVGNLSLAVVLCRHLISKLALTTRQRMLALIILLGTFPAYENLVEGQLSLIMLGCCCAALIFAERKKPFVAGLFLSALWFKPQLAILTIVALVLFRYWKLIAGMMAGVGMAIACTLPITGLPVYGMYAHYLLAVLGDHVAGGGANSLWHGRLDLTAGVNGLFDGLFGQSAIRLVDGMTGLIDGALLLLYFVVLRLKPKYNSEDRHKVIAAITLILILLLDPHLYQQDVIFIYLLLPLLARKLADPLRAIAIFTVVIDLLVLDYLIPLHLFTLALLGLMAGLSWSLITRRGLYGRLAAHDQTTQAA